MEKLVQKVSFVSLIICFAILMVSYHARSEMFREEVMGGKINSYWGKIIRNSSLSRQQLKRKHQDDAALAPSATNRTLPSAVLVYNR